VGAWSANLAELLHSAGDLTVSLIAQTINPNMQMYWSF